MKVSWQVTGIRNDPWANAHLIKVEADKPDRERGYYIHPDLYGQPAEKKKPLDRRRCLCLYPFFMPFLASRGNSTPRVCSST